MGKKWGGFNPNLKVQNLKYFHAFNCSDYEYIKTEYKKIVTKIKQITKQNKNIKFNVYTDDSRVQFILKPILLSGIKDNISKLILISEGSITYDLYEEIKQNDEKINELRWQNLINNIKNEKDEEELLKIQNYSFWLSTLENVEYLIPNHELLKKKINEEYKNRMNLKELNYEYLFKKIPNKYREKLLTKYDKDFLKKDKKILIIIGTYPFGSKRITAAIYENLINQVIKFYKDEYTIVFKPHPIFSISDNSYFKTYLDKNNIIILDSKIPIEVLLWENTNIVIGGFCSSVNALIDLERTKFIFGDTLGFIRLMEDDNNFNPDIYNICVNQKLASALIEEYDNYRTSIQKLSNNYNELVQKNNLLKTELFNYKEKIDTIENELVGVFKFVRKLRKIKKFFIRK